MTEQLTFLEEDEVFDMSPQRVVSFSKNYFSLTASSLVKTHNRGACSTKRLQDSPNPFSLFPTLIHSFKPCVGSLTPRAKQWTCTIIYEPTTSRHTTRRALSRILERGYSRFRSLWKHKIRRIGEECGTISTGTKLVGGHFGLFFSSVEALSY